MLERLLAAFVALLGALERWLPVLAAYWAGKEAERNGKAQEALQAYGEAAEARRAVANDTTDDRLRRAAERGRLRGVLPTEYESE